MKNSRITNQLYTERTEICGCLGKTACMTEKEAWLVAMCIICTEVRVHEFTYLNWMIFGIYLFI